MHLLGEQCSPLLILAAKIYHLNNILNPHLSIYKNSNVPYRHCKKTVHKHTENTRPERKLTKLYRIYLVMDVMKYGFFGATPRVTLVILFSSRFASAIPLDLCRLAIDETASIQFLNA